MNYIHIFLYARAKFVLFCLDSAFLGPFFLVLPPKKSFVVLFCPIKEEKSKMIHSPYSVKFLLIGNKTRG